MRNRFKKKKVLLRSGRRDEGWPISIHRKRQQGISRRLKKRRKAAAHLS